MIDPTPKPRILAFEVTRRCKFNCLHCRASAESNPTDQLTTDQCEKILKSIADYHKCVVVLTGGEPTEREDIYQLISYGKSLGLPIAMATCGYSINEQSIIQLKQAGVLTLSFSLDGATPETHDSFRQTPGAFQIAIDAANLTRQAGLRFQINTTVTKANIDEVDKIAQLACRLGAYCFNPFILVPTGRGKNLKDQLLGPQQYEKLLGKLAKLKTDLPIELRVTCGPQFARISKQLNPDIHQKQLKGCLGGTGFGFISYKGDVQTCGFLDISAGNLIENNFDFRQIWTQSAFLKQIRDTSQYTGKCRTCSHLETCRGCRARAYALCDNYLGPDPICAYLPGEKS